VALCIGINALFLIPGGVGGTEIYLRFLLRSLSRIDKTNDYVVFLNRETGSDLVPASPRFRGIRCAVRASFRPARILFEQTRLPRMLARHDIDVLLNPGFTAPLFARCPQVTVFHDLQHKIHPEFFRVRDLPFWNMLLAGSAACSRRLIAVSDNTARDLAQRLPRAKGKIAAVPHGVDPAFFEIAKERREHRGSARPTRPFILVVSTLHPHKNLERAVEAFRHFRTAHPEYRLVVAGLKGFAARGLQEQVRSLGLQEHIEFTGWIPRSDLYSLFAAASALLAPSLFEGFGLPLVEALAAGIPSACSAIPPFREIAGEIAYMFDPSSTDAIREALEMVTQNEDFRARAMVEGPQRASGFDWDKTAEATLRELIAAARFTQPDHESTQETGVPPAPTKTALRAPAPPTSNGHGANPTRRSV
jgi:glycosyltransferase involved in cell wall biosynthesis